MSLRLVTLLLGLLTIGCSGPGLDKLVDVSIPDSGTGMGLMRVSASTVVGGPRRFSRMIATTFGSVELVMITTTFIVNEQASSSECPSG